MMIGTNLNPQQIQRADELAKHLAEKFGVKVSRSAAIGRAIDALFLSECLTDKTNDESVIQIKESAAA